MNKSQKTAIYDLERGTLAASEDLTAQELNQAKADIAATFSRIPESAQAIIWERGKVTTIQTTPDGKPTKKLFYAIAG